MKATDIKQTDCPTWAFDLLEELNQDTNNITKNNVYDRLVIALKNDEILMRNYPNLINFTIEAILHDITYKRPRNKVSKQESETRRRLKILFQVLHEELNKLLNANKNDANYTYVFQYIAKEQGITNYTLPKKDGADGLYELIGKAWWSNPNDAIDYDKVKQYIDGEKGNKYAKRIFRDFIPVKIHR